MSRTALVDTAPLSSPVAVPLASNAGELPVSGAIVDVAGGHRSALRYVETVFRGGPVVSDTHGGHLMVKGWLGQGAWSAVYRVKDGVQRKDFALKVIPQQGPHIISYYEGIRKLAQLKHPHIISVHNHFVFKEDDSPCALLCIRLELCEASLEQHILRLHRKGLALPTAEVCAFAAQLASALAYLHRKGMLHGDVSSANVLLKRTPAGALAVRLANLGSSHRTAPPGALPLTITGGSRAYAPPEWVNSVTPCRALTALETPLPSYDLWGLGCVLSEMATMKLILEDRQPHGVALATDEFCLEALKREMA
eukprot:EG_transcript_21157